MNYSEQAIVVDENGKLYFEDNHVTNMLSFIWWKMKNGEKYWDTVTREVEEELGITFSQDRFLDGQKQAVRSFWNEREQKYIDWQSTYFVLVLLADEVKNIQENVQLITLGSSPVDETLISLYWQYESKKQI